MPYLDIRIANANLDEPTRRRLGRRGTALLQEILGKRPELTAVSITDLPAGSWMVGERLQSDSGRPAAHAEVTITAGTNTPEQQARFIAETAALLKETLPGLHEATYVVVREIAATSWGYDGLTQDARKRARAQAPEESARPPAERLPAEPRRSASGAIDTQFYMAQAQRLRNETLHNALRRLFAAIVRLPVRLHTLRRRPVRPLRPC